MTRFGPSPFRVNGFVGGLVQDAEPGVLPLGAIVEGENLVALPSGLQRTRGGSRIMLTLHDDNGTPAEVDHVCLLTPFTPAGVVAIGYSATENKHYAYRLTDAIAFAEATEALSRTDLTASPSTTWDNAADPARPVSAELFEKLFLADATVDFSARNEFLSFDGSGTILRPAFSFDGGSAAPLKPYCLEEYNGVLVLAGYGDGGDEDRPELLRHSFLGRSPDDTTGGAEGFDADAYLLLGAKGRRVTALRKGRGLLLAAKQHELYRITGFGRAYSGWQYTVENVHNTQGLGISNPQALAFAEGFWYGVGLQGPMRTDGYAVESLVGPRQRGWRGMDQPERAWVAYHAERRVILFGLHPTQAVSGRSASYPWVLWVWDLERDVWQTDWKFGADLFVGTGVAPAEGSSSASTGASAAPSSPVTSAETTSGYTAGWTNGDATAETEVWEQPSGGAWMLVTTVAAGVTSYDRTGRTSHTTYAWRVRHRKSGVTTDYTAATPAQTLIAAPAVTGCGQLYSGTDVSLTVTQNDDGTDITIERSDDGGSGWSTVHTEPAAPSGTFTVYLPAGFETYFRAKSKDAAWPTPDSAYSSVTQITALCNL